MHARAQILTGEGPLGQLQLELGLPEWGVDLLVLGIVGYSFVGGLRPGSPTFSEANQRDVRKRGAGALAPPASSSPLAVCTFRPLTIVPSPFPHLCLPPAVPDIDCSCPLKAQCSIPYLACYACEAACVPGG